MTPTYISGSIAGTQLSRSFNKTFTVEFTGAKEATRSGKGWMHPMFESPTDPSMVGVPMVTIELPNESHPACEIGLMVSIPTPTLGAHDLRPITKDEIKALRAHWQSLRQAVLEDAFTYGEDLEPLFDRIDIVMTAQTVKLYAPDPAYPARLRLAYVGTPPTPAPKPKSTPTLEEPSEPLLAYAVTYAYDERGRYHDEEPEILLLSESEKDLLTKTVVHECYNEEDLNDLSGKFYEAAAILRRAKQRTKPTYPLSINGCLLIWLQ
jgi:hypothetical protein